jgi:hypothetical protein
MKKKKKKKKAGKYNVFYLYFSPFLQLSTLQQQWSTEKEALNGSVSSLNDQLSQLQEMIEKNRTEHDFLAEQFEQTRATLQQIEQGSFIHLTHSSHSFTITFIYLLLHSFIHSFTNSFTQSFIHLFHLFHSFIYSFIQSFISFIHFIFFSYLFVEKFELWQQFETSSMEWNAEKEELLKQHQADVNERQV